MYKPSRECGTFDQFCVLLIRTSTFSRRDTIEDSDSESDEEVDGGNMRHDLMMADEKVSFPCA